MQLNDKDVFWVSLFTGNGSKMDKAEGQEAGEQGTGSRRFWPPYLLNLRDTKILFYGHGLMGTFY